MIKYLSIIILTLSVIFGSGVGIFILPIKGVQAQSEFNANLLIADTDFRNTSSMTENQIQDFLVAKNSMLKTYTQDGKTAAKIIYDAANGVTSSGIYDWRDPTWHRQVAINPQVLLVTLQKEESLITGQFDQTTYNNRLRIAMGYGCPDSGGCEETYYGFYNQLNYAAWQFDWNFERSILPGYSDYKVGQTMTFSDWNGKHTVTIGNQATASLYRYTPHVYNGNYNFWLLFNNWFGPGAILLPVARVSDGAPIYILSGGRKWPIADLATFEAWGYTSELIQTKTQGELDALATAETVTTFVKGSGATIYLIDNKRKRPFKSTASIQLTGHGGKNAATLADEIINSIPRGDYMSHLVKPAGSSMIYYLNNNTLYHVRNRTYLDRMGLSRNDVVSISSDSRSRYNYGRPISYIIKGPNSSRRYLFVRGEKKIIWSNKDFKHWKFSSKYVVTVPNEFLNSIPNSYPVTKLAKGANSKIYYIANGTKRHVRSATVMKRHKWSKKSVIRVPDALLKTLKTGRTITR